MRIQQTIMGPHFAEMLQAQSTAAVRSIRQHNISIEEAVQVCQIIHGVPWTEAQKQAMGKAVADTVACMPRASKKGKRENQEISNF